MKKKLLFSVIVFLLITKAFSQNILLNESFDSVGVFVPSGWASHYEGGDTWKQNTEYAYSGIGCAKIGWMNTNNFSKGWLITSKITVPNNGKTVLSFFQRTQMGKQNNQFFKIMITDGAQDDYAGYDSIVQYDEDSVGTTYSEKTIDISSYNGASIYIALISVQDDGNAWIVDDVKVTNDGVLARENTQSNVDVLKVYPNPAKDIISIESVGNEGIISVVNGYGTVVMSAKQQNNITQLNLNGLEKGVYFIELTNGENRIVKKFVKE